MKSKSSMSRTEQTNSHKHFPFLHFHSANFIHCEILCARQECVSAESIRLEFKWVLERANTLR
jgi:hypothetical protein